MEALKIVEKKKERSYKPKIELITAAHIIDSYRLLEKSMKENKWTYPSLDEENPGAMRAVLFSEYIAHPNFLGAMLKVNRKPVGQIVGRIDSRSMGHPHHYLFIFNFYMDAEWRKKGFMKMLVSDYFATAKKLGVHHWEANCEDALMSELTADNKEFKTTKLYTRIGGKLGG